MREFRVVTLSPDRLLYESILENYEVYESKFDLLMKSSKDMLLSHINSTDDGWLSALCDNTKIDILILSDINLDQDRFNHFSSQLHMIDSKVSKLVNLTDFQICDREIHMPKPFKLFELLEIISSFRSADGVFRILSSGWIYCSNRSHLQNNEEIIKLTNKESDVIEHLLGEAGYKSSKRDLLEKLWNYNSNSVTSTIDTHLYKLKQKLPENMFGIDGDMCFLNI